MKNRIQTFARRARQGLSGVVCSLIILTLGQELMAAEQTVSIRDDFFTPKNLTVAPGDTVRWVHEGNEAHTTTSDSGIWDSGTMNHGASYSVTFNDLGTFPYHCKIHGQAMSGTIRVANPGEPPPADMFLVNISAKCSVGNEDGRLAQARMTSRDFLHQCAVETGHAEKDLVLVYNVDTDAIEAVDRNDGTTVCTVAKFAGGVTVSTSDGTRKERQSFVYWEGGDEASGSMAGSERSRRSEAGELMSFSLHGTLQLGLELEENGHETLNVCQASFSTSRRFVPRSR